MSAFNELFPILLWYFREFKSAVTEDRLKISHAVGLKLERSGRLLCTFGTKCVNYKSQYIYSSTFSKH